MSSKTKSRKRKTASQETPVVAIEPGPGLLENRTLGWSLFSAFAIWLAFPPVGAWPLAWVAPYGWLRLISMPQLDGRRPLRMVYLVAGVVYWLLMTWWVTLPHWGAAIGWFFLAGYLGIYILGFIALARWLVHRAGWSTVLAAPVAWVAMEIARSYLFSGFALVPLSHSQVDFIPVLQLARYTGAYGVSFLIMLVAACFERAIRHWFDATTPKLAWPLGASVLCVALTMLLVRSADTPPDGKTAAVAIIQGSLDTTFPGDAREMDRAFKHYSRMTREVTAKPGIDLVVWPESMFRFDIFTYEPELADIRPGPRDYTFREWSEITDVSVTKMISDFGTNCLMGTSTLHFESAEGDANRYNTAAFYAADGERLDSYHKMHPVMFGEYAPLGDVMPWIYEFMPIREGLSAGTEPKCFQAGELAFAPNICFENTVPHLIRRQLLELERGDKKVDALVTITNDGWFWGSSLLDVHLACGIFRAVENGRPMLIAANTGFSAEIDPFGRVLQQGPRRASGVIVANVPVGATSGMTVYTRFGDWFGIACSVVAGVGLVIGLRRPMKSTE